MAADLWPADPLTYGPLTYRPLTYGPLTYRPPTYRVLTYSPCRCGHCKQMAADYEKVAQSFATEDAVVVAKINSDKFKDFISKFDIGGYPTLKLFTKASKVPWFFF